MPYVLIIVILSNSWGQFHQANVTMQEFGSEYYCKQAESVILADTQDWKLVKTHCVPKT
jgi:hypothetical protein